MSAPARWPNPRPMCKFCGPTDLDPNGCCDVCGCWAGADAEPTPIHDALVELRANPDPWRRAFLRDVLAGRRSA